ncbi:MAG: hypothetical protein K9G76_04990 [Bacteroidales bacterium]|nr:hypothetical protein [Bacteroidales bacterium]MCF8403035.1 hypothetical protein [Bacteroidales bacterium]
MKNKSLITSILLMVLSLAFLSTDAQNQLLIDLNNPSLNPSPVDFYVLDVMDGREVQNLIGMVKSEDFDEIAMLNFSGGFQNELYGYFTKVYPAKSGKNPVILKVTKLWVNEIEKEGSRFGKCEVELEFLTPKKQMFFKCSQSHEAAINVSTETHKDNILISLDKCMQSLNDPYIQKEYYTILNNSKPAETVEPSGGTQNTGSGSKEKQSKFAEGESTSRIALHGGYTYRTAKLPEGIDSEYANHLKNLKNGIHFGSDLNFFLNPSNALGASFSYSIAKSTLSNVVAVDEFGDIIASGDLTENISLLYIGPSYFTRYITGYGKTHWLYGITAGYYSYKEDFEWLGETVDITGATAGLGLTFGADFPSSNNFALGFQVSMLIGWLSEIDIDGQTTTLDESENLSRFDFTVGIRILP